jgi:hypothetical protein
VVTNKVLIQLIALRSNEKISKNTKNILDYLTNKRLSSLFFCHVTLNKRFLAIYEYPLVWGGIDLATQGTFGVYKSSRQKDV